MSWFGKEENSLVEMENASADFVAWLRSIAALKEYAQHAFLCFFFQENIRKHQEGGFMAEIAGTQCCSSGQEQTPSYCCRSRVTSHLSNSGWSRKWPEKCSFYNLQGCVPQGLRWHLLVWPRHWKSRHLGQGLTVQDTAHYYFDWQESLNTNSKKVRDDLMGMRTAPRLLCGSAENQAFRGSEATSSLLIATESSCGKVFSLSKMEVYLNGMALQCATPCSGFIAATCLRMCVHDTEREGRCVHRDGADERQ